MNVLKRETRSRGWNQVGAKAKWEITTSQVIFGMAIFVLGSGGVILPRVG